MTAARRLAMESRFGVAECEDVLRRVDGDEDVARLALRLGASGFRLFTQSEYEIGVADVLGLFARQHHARPPKATRG